MFSAFYLANCCQFHRLIVIFINIIFSAVGVTLFRTPQGERRSIGQGFVVSKSRDGLLEDDGHVGMPNKAEAAAGVLETAFCHDLRSVILSYWSISADM